MAVGTTPVMRTREFTSSGFGKDQYPHSYKGQWPHISPIEPREPFKTWDQSQGPDAGQNEKDTNKQ
jgi:hypothetical protein